MRLLQGHHHASRICSGQTTTLTELAVRTDCEELETRFEPESLASRTRAADPYEAWLARQEAEHEQLERPEIRWVYRHQPAPRRLACSERAGEEAHGRSAAPAGVA